MLRLAINQELFQLEHITTDLPVKRTDGNALHAHPVFHLLYVTEGRGIFHVNGEAYEAAEGMLFIINPNEPHYFTFDPATPMTNYECTFLMRDSNGEPAALHFLDFVGASRAARPPLSHFRTWMVVREPQRHQLLESFQRILEARKDGVGITKPYLTAIVLDLILRVEEIAVRTLGLERNTSVRTEDHTIAQAKQYLRARLANKVALQELAAHVHLTPNYLCTLFKAHTGSTPMSYLKALRLKEAERLLRYTDLSIYQIAENTGFQEASYFAKVFRQSYGVSPIEFRNG